MTVPEPRSRKPGGRFAPGRSGNPKGRPRRNQNTADLLRAAIEQPVRIKRNGKTEAVSTLEACILTQMQKAAQGNMSAINFLLALLEMTGRSDTMTSDERESRTLELPGAYTSDEYAIMMDPARGREAWQMVSDSGKCKGDKYAKERRFKTALGAYRLQLDEKSTDGPTAAACIAGIGLIAYKLLYAGEFERAIDTAEQALSRNPPFDAVWISAIRAHAQMLGGHPEKAEQFYLGVQTPKASFYSLESQILREFEALKSAGFSHPLMNRVENVYRAAGWTTERKNALLEAELLTFGENR